MHILILGGTTEATALLRLLENYPQWRTTLSLAGRTSHPVLPQSDYRIGGFGGWEGLSTWLREQKITALIDATHPFAKHMPFNAQRAARESGVPLLSLMRPPWQADERDQWREVAGHEQAIVQLGASARRVFLTVGRLELEHYAAALQHHYIVRSIDPVEHRVLPQATWIHARGPFTVEAERALMDGHKMDVLVTKNSGGSATEAKLLAARELRLPVILLARPAKPDVERVATVDEAVQWIARVHGISL